MSAYIAALEKAMVLDSALFRLDLPDTRELEAFQLEQNNEIDRRTERAKLAAIATPTFRWWQVTGTWPRDDGGWVVLLGKATFNVGRSPVARALEMGRP